MAVQTTYSERMAKGLPGQPQGSDYDASTGICETAAGIGFGLAVGRGTGVKGVTLGAADLAHFKGVSIRDITLGAETDKYPQYKNVGVYERGLIYVLPSVAVAPGDPVHFDATTGVFKNSGGVGPIVGAEWIEPGDDATVALLKLYNPRS